MRKNSRNVRPSYGVNDFKETGEVPRSLRVICKVMPVEEQRNNGRKVVRRCSDVPADRRKLGMYPSPLRVAPEKNDNGAGNDEYNKTNALSIGCSFYNTLVSCA